MSPQAATTRTDPIPADPQEEVRKLVDDILSKINKVNISLLVAAKCDIPQVYRLLSGRCAGMARMLAGLQDGRGENVRVNANDTDVWASGVTDEAPPLNPHALPYPPTSSPWPTYKAAGSGAGFKRRFQVCRTTVGLRDAEGRLVPVEAIVDSGASRTVVSIRCLRDLQRHDDLRPTNATFTVADGNKGRAAGKVRRFQITLGDDLTHSPDVYVSKAQTYDLLLGNDFLYPIGANIQLRGPNPCLSYLNDEGFESAVPVSVTEDCYEREIRSAGMGTHTVDIADEQGYTAAAEE